MSSANSIVFVVDDDPSVRDALSNLLDSVGLAAQTFGSSEEFLSSSRPEVPSCLVLDAKLPGMSGPEFQEELRRTGIQIPIIFITAHGDVPMTRKVMKAGAIEFLTKPFQKGELLGAIRHGLGIGSEPTRRAGRRFRVDEPVREADLARAGSIGVGDYGPDEQRDCSEARAE